jgi:hypothetical protein
MDLLPALQAAIVVAVVAAASSIAVVLKIKSSHQD